MAIEIRVPALGESIAEATVGKWLKKAGDVVRADEPLVELETEKVTVEVPSPVSGRLTEISADEGAAVAIGAILGFMTEGEQVADLRAAAPAKAAQRGAS